MILLQVLLLVILIVLGIRLATHVLRTSAQSPREIADLQARVLELEKAVAQIHERQADVRDTGISSARLLPRRIGDQSEPTVEVRSPPNEML